MQGDAAVFAQLHPGERGFRPGAEVFLHAAEADAIALAGMAALKLGLAFGALEPYLMLRRLFQHFIGADRTGRDRPLGVFHAGFQHVAQAELDRVNLQLGGQLIHHHLGGGHALQRAVTARRTGVDGA
jgi:hypothetical protein